MSFDVGHGRPRDAYAVGGVVRSLERERIRLYLIAFGEDDRALHGIFELAHVTRPAVGDQLGARRGAEPIDLTMVFAREFAQEVIG